MLALEGIKVLEVAQTPIASFCTMLLGDFGAEVLKIESPPKAGAEMYSSLRGEENRKEAVHQSLLRNKKNVVLNLRSEEGHNIFLKLAEKADVIIEGFRPGTVKRLGIDYETLSKTNPGLIFCSVSGYGQDGPYRDFPGHDINYISIGGALRLSGLADDLLSVPVNFVGDWAGGALHAVIGILLALQARTHTGRGQYVDISITDGVVGLLHLFASDYFFNGLVPKKDSIVMNGPFPYYSVYETKGGEFVSIGCLEPVFWENLCREIGRDDLLPFCFTPPGHVPNDAEGKEEPDWGKIISSLRETFLNKTSDEWIELLRDKNIPITKVYDMDEALSDPQILHRKMVVEQDHPDVGKVKQLGIAIKLSDTPGEIRGFPPLLGEHTEEVLEELGYTGKEIDRLRNEGIIV